MRKPKDADNLASSLDRTPAIGQTFTDSSRLMDGVEAAYYARAHPYIPEAANREAQDYHFHTHALVQHGLRVR